MPQRRRLNVDDNHSPSSPVRHRRRVDQNGFRSNTASRNAGMLSKEEQERRDAQMALELQQEEEERLIRERAQVIEPTLTPGALSRIISSPLRENRASVRHLGPPRRNSSNTRQQSRRRHNRTRSESPRNTRNNVVVLMLNSVDCLNGLADTLIEIRTRMQAANDQEFNVRTNATQFLTSHDTEEIESDESVGLEFFELDNFDDSSNGSLSSEDPSMYSEEHESGLSDSEESDVHLNDSMNDLESENHLSTGDENDDELEEDSTQSSDSEDFNDDDEISDGELSDNSSEYDLSIDGESSMNDAQIDLASCDSDDMFDGELTLGDDSEIDTSDSEDGDDEDEDENENESIASSNDASEDSIEEDELNDAGSTNEEDESDGESGDDDISSLSSGSSMDVEDNPRGIAALNGPRQRHLLFGQLLSISDLLVANERREQRGRRDTTPLEPPDETVIQCSDWGQCTICFEDAPYDPVGCLHCQQLIGCKPCVNRWFRGGGRQRADSPLSLGLSGVNHRQCPLCRHEYEAATPEVGSMFVLAPKH